MSYFKDAKVGDRVYDYVYGDGTIVEVCKNKGYIPFIMIEFEDIGDQYHLDGTGWGERGNVNQRLFYYDNRPIVITQDDLDIKDADEYCLDDYSFTGNTSRDWADEITIQDYTEEKYTRKIRRDTPEIVKDKQSELTKLGLMLTATDESDVDRIDSIVDELCEIAYRNRTPEFVKDITEEANKLRFQDFMTGFELHKIKEQLDEICTKLDKITKANK